MSPRLIRGVLISEIPLIEKSPHAAERARAAIPKMENVGHIFELVRDIAPISDGVKNPLFYFAVTKVWFNVCKSIGNE